LRKNQVEAEQERQQRLEQQWAEKGEQQPTTEANENEQPNLLQRPKTRPSIGEGILLTDKGKWEWE
jgi:hypothetical protein